LHLPFSLKSLHLLIFLPHFSSSLISETSFGGVIIVFRGFYGGTLFLGSLGLLPAAAAAAYCLNHY
jgi:hypothetical protein